MRPIQLLVDEAEVNLIDAAARKRGTDRSKMIREAVRCYLVTLEREAGERQYVESYRKRPQEPKEFRAWGKVQSWPAD